MKIWVRMKNKGIQRAVMMVENIASINAYYQKKGSRLATRVALLNSSEIYQQSTDEII